MISSGSGKFQAATDLGIQVLSTVLVGGRYNVSMNWYIAFKYEDETTKGVDAMTLLAALNRIRQEEYTSKKRIVSIALKLI